MNRETKLMDEPDIRFPKNPCPVCGHTPTQVRSSHGLDKFKIQWRCLGCKLGTEPRILVGSLVDVIPEEVVEEMITEWDEVICDA